MMGRGATTTPAKNQNAIATGAENTALANQASIGAALMPNLTNELSNPQFTPAQHGATNSLRLDKRKPDRHWVQKAFSKGKTPACPTADDYRPTPKSTVHRLGVLRPLYAYCDAASELGRMVASDAQMQQEQAQRHLDAPYGLRNPLFGSVAEPATETSRHPLQGRSPWYDANFPSTIGEALLGWI